MKKIILITLALIFSFALGFLAALSLVVEEDYIIIPGTVIEPHKPADKASTYI